MRNITDSLVKEILSLTSKEIPASAIWHAKRCLLDYLGSTLAGAHALESKLDRMMCQLGDGEGGAPVIGLNRNTSIMTAALVNGISSHAAELDDGVISGIVHPGSPILSALLPFAAQNNVSGQRLLVGIVAGYETTIRIANSIQPSHKLSGYHATATCGSLGAAVGIMVMAEASEKETKDALSAAAVAAGGSLKVLEDESQLKPFNPGHAALSAIVAVSLARVGFQGPSDVLAGTAGFLQMMSDNYDLDVLLSGCKRPLAIEDVYFKPYASCRYTHPAIEASLKIQSSEGFDVRNVESISVGTYDLAVKNHDHTNISGVSSAKMSIPYSVAIALAEGAANIREYERAKDLDAEIIGLTSKVTVSPESKWTESFPEKTGASVLVRMKSGRDYFAEVEAPKGEPANPLSDEEVENKFDTLALFAGLSEEKTKTIKDSIWNIEEKAENLYRVL